MSRFIALIKYIVEKENEKFIVVSDRLFLVTLAYYVLVPDTLVLMSDLYGVARSQNGNVGG